MKNEATRLNHSKGSLFVLSTRHSGVIAVASVGLAAITHHYLSRAPCTKILLSVGALQAGWAGANLAISFLEAPVKFTAPTPARRSLIDVGTHVFSAFNKVEIVLATFDLLGWYLLNQRQCGLIGNGPGSASSGLLSRFGIHGWRSLVRLAPSFIVLGLESFALLPLMRNHAMRYIEGQPVERSKLHPIIVTLELAKVVSLIVSTVGIGNAILRL